MKCFEVTGCSDDERKNCYVWNSLGGDSPDMENVKCWVLKGAYQHENRALLQKCHQCKYYHSMNAGSGIEKNIENDTALVSCEGTINNDRTRGLERVWGELVNNKKTVVLLDLVNVNNIYSCGLGMIVKIHKEAEALGGILLVVGAQGYIRNLFDGTKLSRILHMVPDRRAAHDLLEARRRKLEAAEKAAAEAAKPKPKKRIPCWEYWQGHNPRNATGCNECYKKVNPSPDPCWIVEGMIEGVSFQYVNEECESCPYFVEFSNSPSI